MAGTRLRGGVDGLPAAGMQADCRSLQMIAVAFCGSHDVKGVVDLRSAELRLVRADQYFAAESLFYQRQLIAAAGDDIRDAFAETGAVCKATGQAERHVRAQRGGNGAQALYRPVQIPETIDVGSSRVDLQACKLEYSIVSPK